MTTTTIIARCCALASLLCVCAPAVEAHPLANQSQDSVAYQINQDHTGNIAFTGGFSGTLTQLWSVNLGDQVSYPMTAKGKAFVTVGTSDATLLDAIDLSTGAIVWEKLLPGTSTWADATYDSGNIYVVNGAGNLLGFNASTGKKLWSAQLPQGTYANGYGAPATGNGAVVLQYENDYSQYVAAYDASTGANTWTVSPGNDGLIDMAGVPLVKKDKIYLGAYNEDESAPFLALSPKDGSTVWSTTLGCSSTSAPAFSPRHLFVSISSSYNCNASNAILNPATGAAKGTFSGSATPAMLGKNLIVSVGGALYDYSPISDNVYWSFAGDGYLDSSPIVINGYVAALSSQNGYLYLLDGTTGEQLWTTTLTENNYCCGQGPDTGLGAGEGVLLVPYGGSLYAFAPQSAKPGSRPEPTRVIGRLINGHFVPSQAR